MGRRARSGQTSVEYFLVLSVVTVGVSGAGYVYVPGFRGGVDQLGHDVSRILVTGEVGSSSTDAYGATSGSGVGMMRAGGLNTGRGGTDGSGANVVTSGPFIGDQAKGFSGLDQTVGASTRDPSGKVVSLVTYPRGYSLPDGTNGCNAYAIDRALGPTSPSPMAIYEQMRAQGLTDAQGRSTLAQDQAFLASMGRNSILTRNASLAELRRAVAGPWSVIVVVDVVTDSKGMRTVAPCGKDGCGHTMTVIGFDAQGNVLLQDDRRDENGNPIVYTVPVDQFQRAWGAQGYSMLRVPPAGMGGSALAGR